MILENCIEQNIIKLFKLCGDNTYICSQSVFIRISVKINVAVSHEIKSMSSLPSLTVNMTSGLMKYTCGRKNQMKMLLFLFKLYTMFDCCDIILL